VKLRNKIVFSPHSVYYVFKNKKIRIKDFDFIGLICGDSLSPFGLDNGTIVYCMKVGSNDIKRNDALIIVTSRGPNKNNPKGRICLGKWGNPNKPDKDLMEIENHFGTVVEYFKEVAPEKYGYDAPYSGPIEGWFKTLSCDQCLENQNVLKISRPHDPKQVLGKVKFIRSLSHRTVNEKKRVMAAAA